MLDRALRDERVLALRRSEARVLAELLAPQRAADLAELRQTILDCLADDEHS